MCENSADGRVLSCNARRQTHREMNCNLRLASCTQGIALATILMVAVVLPMPQTTTATAEQNNTWVTETVDSEGDVGSYSSLAFNDLGHPAISYQDRTKYDLRFAAWDGCWGLQTVDSNGYAGFYTSLAYDSRGYPAISYVAYSMYSYGGPMGMTRSSGSELRFAHFNGSTWDIRTIDGGGDKATSLSFDPLSGHPSIAYFNPQSELKHAWFDGAVWKSETIMTAGFVNHHISLAFDPQGNPAISIGGLWYAYRESCEWAIGSVDNDARAGLWNSLAFDSEGNPAISYNGCDPDSAYVSCQFIKYAHWDGARWAISNVDTGSYPSLVFDRQGNPTISYASDHKLKMARFDGGSWRVQTIDDEDYLDPAFLSIAVDANGNIAVSYYRSALSSLNELRFAYDQGLKADFEASTVSCITEQDTIEFCDSSIGEIDSWQWDFGDGSAPIEWTSESRPPDGKISHTYTTAGKYTVSLSVSSYRGTHTETKTDCVSVYVPGGEDLWLVAVGVGDYEHFGSSSFYLPFPGIGYDLPYADDDARQVYVRLSPACGTDHTRVLTDADATKDNIRDALVNWLAPQTGPEDTVVLFFSGHGRAEYLCPHDSLPDSYANDITVSALKTWLDKLSAERVVVILDSCESGGFAEGLAADGRVVLAACASDESSYSLAEIEHGIFSHYLLSALHNLPSVDSDGNQRVSAEELFYFARPLVAPHAARYSQQQHPEIHDGCPGEVELFSIVTMTWDMASHIPSITIDGVKYGPTQLPVSSTWMEGGTHTVSVPEFVSVAEGTRYAFVSWSDGDDLPDRTITSSESMLLEAEYKTQYYLTVEADYGRGYGEAWYDEGSEASFWVSSGDAYRSDPWYRSFGGWTGDSDASSQEATIVMDGPKSVRATYKLSALIWIAAGTVGFLLTIAVAGAGLFLMYRKPR